MPKRRVDITVYGESPALTLPLISGVAAYGATQGGWRLSLRPLRNSNLIDALAASPAEGILTMAQSPEQAASFLSLGKPIVNYLTELMPTVPSVQYDDVQVGRLAAKHLLDRGLRCMAYLGIFHPASDLRQHGFVEELTAVGVSCTIAGAAGKAWYYPDIMQGDLVRPWLLTLPRPVGILAFNDAVAGLVIEMCEQLGLRVPEDVSVLGIDNDDLLCRFALVPISSVCPGQYRLGFEAAALLDRVMAGETVGLEPQLVPPEGVVMRRSTDVLAIADEDVRNAVHFIREHACDPINVDAVVEQMALSRATLDRRFVAAIGRSPGEEIRRVRLAEARRLLADTRLPLVTIAMQCGFASQQHFSAAFQKAYGAPPGTFRKSLHIL